MSAEAKKKSQVAAVVQVRLGSTRLPGKALMPIEGVPVLGHLIRRIGESSYIRDIVIATTTQERDDPIVQFAIQNRLKYYRGSENDVLDRFFQAASMYGLETIVRITADCPMLDPRQTDRVIEKFLEGRYDYVANSLKPTYPDGLDTEVFSNEILARAWREAKLPSEREHVTSYITHHPELFRHGNVEWEGEDISWMRWTIDTERDYEFVSQVFRKIGRGSGLFFMEDVLATLREYPELLEINKGIIRNEGYLLSLSKDGKVQKND